MNDRQVTDQKPRWQYRFNNYKRAFALLREGIELLDAREGLTQLEKEGVIQRFEYSMELAWKVMADYLEHQNMVFPTRTPRSVIRKAFETGLIRQGAVWMDALDARNKVSHVYDFNALEEVIADIQLAYLQVMDELYMRLLAEIVEVEI